MVSHRAKEFKRKVGAALIIGFALTLDTVSVHQTKLDLSHVSVFLSSLSSPRCLTLIQDNWTVEHIPLKTAAALPRHINAACLCEASSDEFWRIKNPLVLILFQSSKVEQQEVRFHNAQLLSDSLSCRRGKWWVLYGFSFLPGYQSLHNAFSFVFSKLWHKTKSLGTKGGKHDYCCGFFFKRNQPNFSINILWPLLYFHKRQQEVLWTEACIKPITSRFQTWY